jgi:endoglucanase
MNFRFFFLISFVFINVYAQAGFVRTAGKQIIDPQGNNLILRGLGTGNWMLQEGYMMQSADIAPTEWQFRKKLIETMGVERTNQFYKHWHDNHFRKIDVDSMARWGFNSVRPALHYKIFTLPVEEEPVQGQHIWIEDGFIRLDSLVAWCAANEMYVLFDMHGAPGGQGKDAAISDYDSSKPSLWESELNKQKFIALWRRIAERYADNPWVAGYDLLNETNWTFSEGNNSQMMDLYQRTTRAIREVDTNHMIVIGGNWFSNDFSGLTPPWDNNMVYTFHKYWTYNNTASIQWVLDLRNATNCPIWLGESGENSNTWFTDCIELMETNNIGWAFWPVKKTGINNILRAKTNSDYTALINSWKGNGAAFTADQTFNAVMAFADNHRFENCVIQHDVIDAMIRQPLTKETKAFKNRSLTDVVYAVDYDFGRQGYAYNDLVVANYHLSENGNYSTWNSGWNYRNDGVDIEVNNDDISNGFHVGWIENDEWLQYTFNNNESMTYNMIVRYASALNTAKVYIEINGKRASKSISLASTGGWSTWRSAAITNIIIPAGEVKLKVVFEQGGVNFNYFQLRNPKTIASTAFEMLGAETDTWKNALKLKMNKAIDALVSNAFSVKVNGNDADIIATTLNSNDNSVVDILLNNPLLTNSSVSISYNTEKCKSGTQNLVHFTDVPVNNKITAHHTIPGKIEAENFAVNNGFTFETCTDTGGGKNTSYAAKDKYLDYYVWVNQSGNYSLEFRISVNSPSAQIAVLLEQNGNMVPQKVVSFSNSGGWQNWQTTTTTLQLSEGKNIIRLLSRTDGFNLNWINFPILTYTVDIKDVGFKIYPNPARDFFEISFDAEGTRLIQLIDLRGGLLKQLYSNQSNERINVSGLNPGMYLIKVKDALQTYIQKLRIV